MAVSTETAEGNSAEVELDDSFVARHRWLVRFFVLELILLGTAFVLSLVFKVPEGKDAVEAVPIMIAVWLVIMAAFFMVAAVCVYLLYKTVRWYELR